MAMQGFTWVRNTTTGGYWQCPDGVLDHFRALGWEPSEAPPEPNPAIAERVAWEAEQASARETAAAESAKPKTPTKAARSGETQES